jgi:hypothetical protein
MAVFTSTLFFDFDFYLNMINLSSSKMVATSSILIIQKIISNECDNEFIKPK